MKKFITEFKAFAMRGNVIDLAVAVIIGAAFGKITTSLVNNIVMPIFGALLGGVDFTDKSFTVGEAVVTYGVFIQSIIEFIIIALAIFVVIKVLTKLHKKEEEKPKESAPKGPSEEVLLLREIRDSLKQR
ncbi:MAG: large-conductance mechanosensitive channel protein MscL [Candidatus Paceibacteria bacterium]